MTVEVRFLNPEGWKKPDGTPVNETELIETLQGEQAAFKQRASRRFTNDEKSLFVVDKRPVDDRGEEGGFRLVEGAEVDFQFSSSKLGHMPLGARIEIWEGRSESLKINGEVVAEIKHIPATG